MNTKQSHRRHLLTLIGGALVAIVMFAAVYNHFSYHSYQQDEKISQINRVAKTQSSMNVLEQKRVASINKILAIINRYNKAMEMDLRQRIANEIYLMSTKYPNLNINFICATITHESAKTWDPRITSHAGAMGLMQIMPTTGAFLAAEEGISWSGPEMVLYDPILNIRLGCRYLSELVRMYEKDGGLAAYNGGPKRAERWLAANRDNQILVEETRYYIPAVLKLYDEFRSQGTL